MTAIPIAVVGVGKIARDQHLPSIAASDRFVLAGAVSPQPVDLEVPVAGTLRALKERVPTLAAASICTPPIGRAALIEEAVSLGLDVMVEKPPAASLTEAERFAGLAKDAGRTLFLAWHSREAAAVEPLRSWLLGREIARVAITWREDVRVWHPGQEWIWTPGIGVFDPGINALSILTQILSAPVEVLSATLSFPANREAPIAAALTMASDVAPTIDGDLSFDQRGPQTWSILVETDGGVAELNDGGGRLTIDGVDVPLAPEAEYDRLYRRFATLIDDRSIDADLAPFRLVADCFLLARRRTVQDFGWTT